MPCHHGSLWGPAPGPEPGPKLGVPGACFSTQQNLSLGSIAPILFPFYTTTMQIMAYYRVYCNAGSTKMRRNNDKSRPFPRLACQKPPPSQPPLGSTPRRTYAWQIRQEAIEPNAPRATTASSYAGRKEVNTRDNNMHGDNRFS